MIGTTLEQVCIIITIFQVVSPKTLDCFIHGCRPLFNPCFPSKRHGTDCYSKICLYHKTVLYCTLEHYSPYNSFTI
jgi:hypothetical protein